MLIISYDLSDDKVRTRFAKYLKKWGRRLQFSVYEIKNSQRILNLCILEIENTYAPQFTKKDSVIIFDLDKKKVYRYGYAANEETDLLIFE